MQYHIQLDAPMLEGAEYAILAGDPGRIEAIAQHLERPKRLGQNREYTSFLGYVQGRPVLVMSHGIGGPSTAIAVEELAQLGTLCTQLLQERWQAGQDLIGLGACAALRDGSAARLDPTKNACPQLRTDVAVY